MKEKIRKSMKKKTTTHLASLQPSTQLIDESDEYNFVSKKETNKTSVFENSVINPSATKRVEISNGMNSNIDV